MYGLTHGQQLDLVADERAEASEQGVVRPCRRLLRARGTARAATARGAKLLRLAPCTPRQADAAAARRAPYRIQRRGDIFGVDARDPAARVRCKGDLVVGDPRGAAKVREGRLAVRAALLHHPAAIAADKLNHVRQATARPCQSRGCAAQIAIYGPAGAARLHPNQIHHSRAVRPDEQPRAREEAKLLGEGNSFAREAHEALSASVRVHPLLDHADDLRLVASR